MAAHRPARAPLEGEFIRLEPMTEAHLPELFAAIGNAAVFAGGYGGGPAGLRTSEAEFIEFARGYYRWDAANVYAARPLTGPLAGALVGTSTLGDFDEVREHAHIGWTAWDPRVWGTVVNPEAKLLMLAEAFGHGFGRVKLQADSLNERSRSAILKLGARFEGIIRRDQLRPDGIWRSTAVYSILAEEWPAVRAGLEQRLAEFRAAGDPFGAARHPAGQ
jgi:N-acetyltransferase